MGKKSDLRLRRQQLGKRQVDIWLETGIWPSRISFIESGLTKPKRQDEIAKLALAYGLSEEDFFRMLDKPRGGRDPVPILEGV
jgi:transcriptional regulator with XRE-family HTH domain